MATQSSKASSCPPRAAVQHCSILHRTFNCSGVGFDVATKLVPNKLTISASSNFVRISGVVIKRIQGTMGLYQRALGYMKVDHGGGYLCMAKPFFEGYNIESLLQKMGCIRVSQWMQVHFLCNGCLLKVFTHDPWQATNTIPAIILFPIKQPDIRVFSLKVFLQANGHTFGQWNNAILLLFTLSDMNGFTFKINVEYFQVDHFLSSQACQVNQCQYDPLFEERWRCKKLFQLLLV